MNAEKFWMGWLRITIYLVITAGFLMVILYHLGLTGYLDHKIDKAFFDGINPGPAVHFLRIWMISIAGAVMMGWGLAMLYIVNHPFQRGEKWAWKSIFYPMVTWYLIDTAVSLGFGVGINVVINTILFLQVIAPLLFLYSQFYPKAEIAA